MHSTYTGQLVMVSAAPLIMHMHGAQRGVASLRSYRYLALKNQFGYWPEVWKSQFASHFSYIAFQILKEPTQ